MLAESLQGLGWDRVDSARANQPIHVKRIRVGRVLRAGGGPQRPLGATAGCLETGKAFTLEYMQEFVIG